MAPNGLIYSEDFLRNFISSEKKLLDNFLRVEVLGLLLLLNMEYLSADFYR